MLTLFIKPVENIHIPIFLLFCLTETRKYKQQEEQMTKTHKSWGLKKHSRKRGLNVCLLEGFLF